MSLGKKIAKNTIIHASGKLIGSVVGVLIVIFLTRYLGTEGYGFYTTAMAYLFFFSTLGDFGLYLVTVNEMSRNGIDQKKFFSNVFTLRFLSGLLLISVANILIWFFPYSSEVKWATIILSGSVFLMMIDQILVSLFQQKMKTFWLAISEIVGKSMAFLFIFFAIKWEQGFYVLMGCFLVGMILHFLIDFIAGRKNMKFGLAFDFDIWKSVLKKTWPVATYMIFSMIYFKADTIVLSLYHPAEVVGVYGAPYKILEVLIGFPAIFMGLVSPHLSSAWSEGNKEKFVLYFQKAFNMLSFAVWPMIFGILFVAEPLMMLIAGPEFLESVKILRILILATGIIFWAHLSTFSVVAIEKQKKMMKYYVLAALLAIVIYFGFIPKYSYLAAAWGTVIVEILILITSWQMVRKEVGHKIQFGLSLKCLLSALVMYGTLYLLDFGFLLSILVAIVVYIGFVFLLGGIKKENVKDWLSK
jgi:O-antigen/teichoic acid export membrane protein